MKDIFVSHSKEDKSIAKKLVSKLESSGVGCYVYSRDKNSGSEKELISSSSIFILILSEYAQQSQDLIRQLKIAVENNCHIIPFKAGKTDTGLSTQYLLHSLEWVDALEDGFDEAFEILLEIIEEMNEGLPYLDINKLTYHPSIDCIHIMACTNGGVYMLNNYQVSINDEDLVDNSIKLNCYPNPFVFAGISTHVTFTYNSDRENPADHVVIYNIKGQFIKNISK